MTGLKYLARIVSWEAPKVELDSAFYEVYAFGRGSFNDGIFQVLELYTYVNSTIFSSVNVTVVNTCGQRSQSVRISISTDIDASDVVNKTSDTYAWRQTVVAGKVIILAL